MAGAKMNLSCLQRHGTYFVVLFGKIFIFLSEMFAVTKFRRELDIQDI